MLSIEKTLNKIERVFDRVKQQGLTFGEHASKKRLADRTIQTYCDVVMAYANYLHKEYGIMDIAKAKPRHAYEYINKQIERFKAGDQKASPFTMRRFAHAIHAFREASAATGVYAAKVKIGDKREILKKLNEEGIFRKSSYSQTLKANHADYECVHLEIMKSQSPNAKQIADIHQVQRYLGARISETLSMKKQDLTFHRDGTLTVRIKGKGGLVRYVATDHLPTIELLRKEVSSKKEAAPVFQMQNRIRQDKAMKSAVKALKENIRLAAIRAGIDRHSQKYTSHSARKVFAQENMNTYYLKTSQQLRKEIAKRVAADPSLKAKYDRTVQNVRSKIKATSPKKNRGLTHKELCSWLVSTDLGHGRLDVIRYYCVYPSKNTPPL